MFKALDGISKKSRIALLVAGLVMFVFFGVQTCIVFKSCLPSYNLALFGYACVVAFMPPFFMVVIEFLKKKEEVTVELNKKNVFLEHSAKIIRHDMHSGINTYIPRGVSSLKRRLNDKIIEELKIEAPLKLIQDGVRHAQKVYSGVYEFTNLVKQGATLNKKECNTYNALKEYLDLTSYKDQVLLDVNLPTLTINEPLFCTAIDNLIRNGLKYNDSQTKLVKVYSDQDYIIVEDNGRGMSQEDFVELSKPYVRKEGQKEGGSGLGLNICTAILEVHGFVITAEKISSNEQTIAKDLDSLEEKISWTKSSYIYDRSNVEETAKNFEYKGRISTKQTQSGKKLIVFFEPTKVAICKGTKLNIKIK